MDGTTISQWCEKNNTDDFGLLISYLPDSNNETILPFIEFYASENNIEYRQPKLNFSYKKSTIKEFTLQILEVMEMVVVD